MSSTNKLDAAGVRAKVSHPIVDGDGHVLEANKTILDYVKKIGGPEMAVRYENMEHPWKYQDVQPIFWGQPSGPHSLDRATAMLPKLYRERLDEAGIDVERYMRVVQMSEVAENEYNLNISRYIDTSEPEPEVDLPAVRLKIAELESREREIDAKLAGFLKELGL